MVKKKCYRVQVGPWKYGLISKCMIRKEADKVSHWINNGWLSSESLSPKKILARRKRFR